MKAAAHCQYTTIHIYSHSAQRDPSHTQIRRPTCCHTPAHNVITDNTECNSNRSIYYAQHFRSNYNKLPLFDIFDLLRPAASLSLGQKLHLAEGTSQSLEQQFGTIFRPICDSTRSHCCHLDKN